MPQNRYYANVALEVGQRVCLADEEFHYLSRVMRSQAGVEVELINGRGALASGTLLSLSKKEAQIEVTKVQHQMPPAFAIRLLLAFLKPAHLEYAIEKATEIGASHFCLFMAQASEKKALSEHYLKRLEAIVLSATKQCGRLFLPTIEIKETLSDCLDDSLTLFGDLESQTAWNMVPLTPNITLAIGPEGGFTEKERLFLLEKGAQGIRLHQNTLRAETAASIGTALLFDKISHPLL